MALDLDKLNKLQDQKDQKEATERATIQAKIDKTFAKFQEYLDSNEFETSVQTLMEHYLTGQSENSKIVMGMDYQNFLDKWHLLIQFGKTGVIVDDFKDFDDDIFSLEEIENSGQDVLEATEPFRTAIIDRVQSLGLKIKATKAQYYSRSLIYVFEVYVR